MQTEIQTERLILKQLTPDYAQVIFDTYAQDPEVCKYTSWKEHESIDVTTTFLQEVQNKRTAGESYTYAIIRKSDDLFVGSIELRIGKKSASFGYVIGRDFRWEGYATEALSAIIALWFSLANVDRIYGYCDIDNIASTKVMENAGLRYVGIREKYILYPNISSEKRDSHRYEIIREKWTH